MIVIETPLLHCWRKVLGTRDRWLTPILAVRLSSGLNASWVWMIFSMFCCPFASELHKRIQIPLPSVFKSPINRYWTV